MLFSVAWFCRFVCWQDDGRRRERLQWRDLTTDQACHVTWSSSLSRDLITPVHLGPRDAKINITGTKQLKRKMRRIDPNEQLHIYSKCAGVEACRALNYRLLYWTDRRTDGRTNELQCIMRLRGTFGVAINNSRNDTYHSPQSRHLPSPAPQYCSASCSELSFPVTCPPVNANNYINLNVMPLIGIPCFTVVP